MDSISVGWIRLGRIVLYFLIFCYVMSCCLWSSGTVGGPEKTSAVAFGAVRGFHTVMKPSVTLPVLVLDAHLTTTTMKQVDEEEQ